MIRNFFIAAHLHAQPRRLELRRLLVRVRLERRGHRDDAHLCAPEPEQLKFPVEFQGPYSRATWAMAICDGWVV
jgi:hypothetical protein